MWNIEGMRWGILFAGCTFLVALLLETELKHWRTWYEGSRLDPVSISPSIAFAAALKTSSSTPVSPGGVESGSRSPRPGTNAPPSCDLRWSLFPSWWLHAARWSASPPYSAYKQATHLQTYGATKDVELLRSVPASSAFYYCPDLDLEQRGEMEKDDAERPVTGIRSGQGSAPVTRAALQDVLTDAVRWWDWKERQKLPRSLKPYAPGQTEVGKGKAMDFVCGEETQALVEEMITYVRARQRIGMAPDAYLRAIHAARVLTYGYGRIWENTSHPSQQWLHRREDEKADDFERTMHFMLEKEIMADDPELRLAFLEWLRSARQMHFQQLQEIRQSYPWLFVSPADAVEAVERFEDLQKRMLLRQFDVVEEADLAWLRDALGDRCWMERDGTGSPALSHCTCAVFEQHRCRLRENPPGAAGLVWLDFFLGGSLSYALPKSSGELIERVMSFTSELWKEVELQEGLNPAKPAALIPPVHVTHLIGRGATRPTQQALMQWLASSAHKRVPRGNELDAATPAQRFQWEWKPDSGARTNWHGAVANQCWFSFFYGEGGEVYRPYHFTSPTLSRSTFSSSIEIESPLFSSNATGNPLVDDELADEAQYIWETCLRLCPTATRAGTTRKRRKRILPSQRWNAWSRATALFYDSLFEVDVQYPKHPAYHPLISSAAIVLTYTRHHHPRGNRRLSGDDIHLHPSEVDEVFPSYAYDPRPAAQRTVLSACPACVVFASGMDLLPGAIVFTALSSSSATLRSQLLLLFRVEVPSVKQLRTMPKIQVVSRCLHASPTDRPQPMALYGYGYNKTVSSERAARLHPLLQISPHEYNDESANLQMLQQWFKVGTLYAHEESTMHEAYLPMYDEEFEVLSLQTAVEVYLRQLFYTNILTVASMSRDEVAVAHGQNRMIEHLKREGKHRNTANKRPTRGENYSPPNSPSPQKPANRTPSPVQLTSITGFIQFRVRRYLLLLGGGAPITVDEIARQLDKRGDSAPLGSFATAALLWRHPLLLLPFVWQQLTYIFHPFTLCGDAKGPSRQSGRRRKHCRRRFARNRNERLTRRGNAQLLAHRSARLRCPEEKHPLLVLWRIFNTHCTHLTDVLLPFCYGPLIQQSHPPQILFQNTTTTSKSDILSCEGASTARVDQLPEVPHLELIETADLQASIEQVKAAKIRAIGQPKIGAHGNPVIFLHPKDCGGVLVELEEPPQMTVPAVLLPPWLHAPWMCVCVEPQQRVVLKRCHMDTFIRSTACAIQMLRRCSAALAGAVPMNLGRLNHVAIAVPKNQDLTKAADIAPLSLPEHGVITVFVELPNSKLELLHPIGDKSPIQGFLDKNPGGGMHHICLETADLQASIEQVKAAKIRAIGQPKIGAHGNPVIFLHPKDCGGVLVELEEVKGK
eukprot:gene7839-5470_t